MAAEGWFEQLPQNLVIGLEQGSLYALVALGYTLVYGVLQLINFAHSEVFMSGAFGSFLVVNGILGNRHLSGVAIPLTIIAGMLSRRRRRVRRSPGRWRRSPTSLRKRGAPKLAF